MMLPSRVVDGGPQAAAGTTAATATVTILGLGSLLSERSSRSTFPELKNFRLGRIPKYRRVFGHPASIFFQRGLANTTTHEYSSLSAEALDVFGADASSSSAYQGGFVCSVFEVPRNQVFEDDEEEDDVEADVEDCNEDNGNKRKTRKRTRQPIPTGEFLQREEEFDITEVPYMDFTDGSNNGDENNITNFNNSYSSSTNSSTAGVKMGVLCTRSTDAAYIQRWGKDRFDTNYGTYGLDTIWGYGPESDLRPCRVYLRHCVLAAQALGPACYRSFLDETFLVDRTTTIRDYLHNHPNLLETTIPPPGFEERYSG